ncbi:MAPEG family protein [Roseibacterium sp. SDUM158016]|uniref:MAPEG family protein n=1 Tax=Roseicyclus sediminis TaxID=2980997 RepID=UPI0021D0538A|nr:MAPEG family protein [Roseibacterium sp. SDUM158016]MCU4654454.1 MAPEG family protein [Roseibacterium sp. SDUM158016]
MSLYSIENPVFLAYAIAVAISALKLMGQGWVTVALMMRKGRGFASPEDLRPGALNRVPDPAKLAPDPDVERSRRMHRNDLENIPGFVFAGFVFVAVDPPYALAVVCFAGFVIARALHAWAYAGAKGHETRATFYTVGSLIVIFMALWSLGALLF